MQAAAREREKGNTLNSKTMSDTSDSPASKGMKRGRKSISVISPASVSKVS